VSLSDIFADSARRGHQSLQCAASHSWTAEVDVPGGCESVLYSCGGNLRLSCCPEQNKVSRGGSSTLVLFFRLLVGIECVSVVTLTPSDLIGWMERLDFKWTFLLSPRRTRRCFSMFLYCAVVVRSQALERVFKNRRRNRKRISLQTEVFESK